MTDGHDIFTEHYRLLRSDPAARQRLVEDPVAGLIEHFGSVPEGNYRIKVISEEPGKITILLPAKPIDGDMSDEAVDAVAHRIYDILFTTGVGGYLIPDASLMWVLRDMRTTWSQHRTAGTGSADPTAALA